MTAHLALPLRVAASGALAAHTPGSPAEVGQSVALLLATRIGERRCEPAYGSTDPLFGPQPATAGGAGALDTAAVARWEPRARAEDVAVTVARRLP